MDARVRAKRRPEKISCLPITATVSVTASLSTVKIMAHIMAIVMNTKGGKNVIVKTAMPASMRKLPWTKAVLQSQAFGH